MSKVKGPLLGLEAHGSVGNALTFRRQRTRQHAQRKFTPKDPKSPEQLSIRTAMHELQNLWQTLTNYQRSSWNNLSKEGYYKNQTGYSLFLKLNFATYSATGTWKSWAPWDMIVISNAGETAIAIDGRIAVFRGTD